MWKAHYSLAQTLHWSSLLNRSKDNYFFTQGHIDLYHYFPSINQSSQPSQFSELKFLRQKTLSVVCMCVCVCAGVCLPRPSSEFVPSKACWEEKGVFHCQVCLQAETGGEKPFGLETVLKLRSIDAWGFQIKLEGIQVHWFTSCFRIFIYSAHI